MISFMSILECLYEAHRWRIRGPEAYRSREWQHIWCGERGRDGDA
jgi:hypothetical protein